MSLFDDLLARLDQAVADATAQMSDDERAEHKARVRRIIAAPATRDGEHAADYLAAELGLVDHEGRPA